MKVLLLLMTALVLSACGSTPSNYKENTTYTKTVTATDTVYENDKTDSPAILVITIAPNYPKAAYNNLTEGFVAVSYTHLTLPTICSV